MCCFSTFHSIFCRTAWTWILEKNFWLFNNFLKFFEVINVYFKNTTLRLLHLLVLICIIINIITKESTFEQNVSLAIIFYNNFC